MSSLEGFIGYFLEINFFIYKHRLVSTVKGAGPWLLGYRSKNHNVAQSVVGPSKLLDIPLLFQVLLQYVHYFSRIKF